MRVLQLDPELLIAFLPKLRDYLKQLPRNDLPTDQDNTAEHLSFFINFLEAEYATRLQEFKSLTSHGEITFDLLRSIFLPQSVIFTLCETTSEPRAVRLRDISLVTPFGYPPYWKLDCEYLDANNDSKLELATIIFRISEFKGVEKIANLKAYPMDWHPNKAKVHAEILQRSQRWLTLAGVKHREYHGVAYYRDHRDPEKTVKVKVCLTPVMCCKQIN